MKKQWIGSRVVFKENVWLSAECVRRLIEILGGQDVKAGIGRITVDDACFDCSAWSTPFTVCVSDSDCKIHHFMFQQGTRLYRYDLEDLLGNYGDQGPSVIITPDDGIYTYAGTDPRVMEKQRRAEICDHLDMLEQELKKEYHLPDSWHCYCGPDDPNRLRKIDELLGYDDVTYQVELVGLYECFEMVAWKYTAGRADYD